MTDQKNRWIFGAGCLFAGALVGALAVGAGPDKGSKPAGAPSWDEAAMQRCMEFGTPGPRHAQLARYAGDWNMTIKMWMDPDGAPEENTATASAKTIMDGRFLVEKVSGTWEFGGEVAPFEGMAITGFDNHKQEFFSLWFDNFSTGVLQEWGNMHGDGRTLETFGSMYNPMVGSVVKTRSVSKLINADTRSTAMYMPGPDGRMFKHMEITYQRR